jgi:hypothetical protein
VQQEVDSTLGYNTLRQEGFLTSTSTMVGPQATDATSEND